MLIVTHEMRFAKDVSSRVFFMDEGIIYEDGTPEQIFENPQKEKTKKFIFRIRSWEWMIESPTFDFFEMNASLTAFCQRQYFGEKAIQAVQLVLEEVLMGKIIPAIKDSKQDEKWKLQINISGGEEGRNIKIRFDFNECLSYIKDIKEKALDEVSKKIIDKYSSYQESDEGNIVEYMIK